MWVREPCSSTCASCRPARFVTLYQKQVVPVQVSALALCKLNKTDVFLRWASPSRRHEAEEGLFWRLDEVPQEALDMLQVGPCAACPCMPSSLHY